MTELSDLYEFNELPLFHENGGLILIGYIPEKDMALYYSHYHNKILMGEYSQADDLFIETAFFDNVPEGSCLAKHVKNIYETDGLDFEASKIGKALYEGMDRYEYENLEDIQDEALSYFGFSEEQIDTILNRDS